MQYIQIYSRVGNLAGRHSRSSLSACQQKPRGSENHRKGYQNPSQIHPKSRKSAPGRRLRNHLKIVVRFLREIMKNDFQMESQRAPEGPPLGEIRGAEGRSGPGPLQDLQNGAQKAGFQVKIKQKQVKIRPQRDQHWKRTLQKSHHIFRQYLRVFASIYQYLFVFASICQDLLPSASISQYLLVSPSICKYLLVSVSIC